ncbi:methyltransferase domain-containing protein [Catelliglobosispora koreensis]|uniref:methyltransferase domain-containing protein n=1 Tax=Catelliglobosispora koreensis TaxID=129052 RepID=UPI00037AE70D|nr:methyltransferase domain-containing protein [Catelliglobosispora koreensis]
MWNPEIYLRFADERGRPFHDLVGRVKAETPRVVEDLGCGPGNLTETLAVRWPDAQIRGVDSSPEMIAAAQTPSALATYAVGDVRAHVPGAEVDVIVTNAMLQWVEGADEILASWVKPGRWIAAQMPANHDAPAHVLLRELCGTAKWSAKLGFMADKRSVGDAVHYARLLRTAGCDHVDTWETLYVHQLPVTGAHHPVLTWLSGTALRPVRAALSDDDFLAYCAELQPRLAEAYPAHDGVVDFPFLRVFAVGYRSS